MAREKTWHLDLVRRYAHLLAGPERIVPPGPVLDLASGACGAGLMLAERGADVICADISEEALRRVLPMAENASGRVAVALTDLERQPVLPEEACAAVIVLRYLHRQLVPAIRRAVRPGGLVLYETFTTEQPRFGKPTNPDFLLRPGELLDLFAGFDILHHSEGVRRDPARATAALVCRRPA